MEASTEVDKEILISQVFPRSVIWDRRLLGHSNRYLVGKAWEEISCNMGVEGAILRKKWKNIRDQYAVELSKVPSAQLGDSKGIYKSKWPYFKSVGFLEDIVKPRPSSSKLKNVEGRPGDDNVQGDEPNITQVYSFEDYHQGTGDPLLERILKTEDAADEDPLQPARKKRVVNESLSDDDDSLFFQSLLPYVRKIPPRLKLRFRNRVQEIVEEFVYPSQQQRICSSSPTPSNASKELEPSASNDEMQGSD